MNKFGLKIFIAFAVISMAFVSCKKEEGLGVVPITQNQDSLSTSFSVVYEKLFTKPSGKIKKSNCVPLTLHYKNFTTGFVRPYKARYDPVNGKLWLAENLKEQQYFATSSGKHPSDPNGTIYGLFYYYNTINICAQSMSLPFPPFNVQQWGFFYDAACTIPMGTNWRIPTHEDISGLVNYLGSTSLVSSYEGINVGFSGWYSHDIPGWQQAIADGMFWLKDDPNYPSPYNHPNSHWTYRVCGYDALHPYPDFTFSPMYNDMAVNIRLVSDM